VWWCLLASRRLWPRVGSLVLVEWDDAWQTVGAHDEHDEVLPTETVGWLIRRTRRSVYIAGERFPDRSPVERWRGVTRVPIGMVTRIVKIA